MRRVVNEQPSRAPFEGKNYVTALASGGSIWLSTKLVSVLGDSYRAVPCVSVSQSPICAAYKIAMVASIAITLLGVYGVGKALVFDYHPERASQITRQPNATPIPKSATVPIPQPQQNGRLAHSAEDDPQSTRRRPLRAYDPMQCPGGSQAI